MLPKKECPRRCRSLPCIPWDLNASPLQKPSGRRRSSCSRALPHRSGYGFPKRPVPLPAGHGGFPSPQVGCRWSFAPPRENSAAPRVRPIGHIHAQWQSCLPCLRSGVPALRLRQVKFKNLIR